MRRSGAARVFGCASVLLSYPEEGFEGDLAAVSDGLRSLAECPARRLLTRSLEWLSGSPANQARTRYVDTFDLSRGTSLYLTYYRHGDTRERGMALSALVDTYRSSGLGLVPGELPDYLPALLEMAAVSSLGAAVMSEHRMALDALRIGLDKAKSGYADVVSAIGEALGASSRADRDALRRYRLQGPPSERVGLEPFAPPEVMGKGASRR